MAKQRKKRKGAGPPPAVSPRRAAMAEAEASGKAPAKRSGRGSAKAPAPKRRPGEPPPPAPRSVIARAAIVAGLFYLYLVYLAGRHPGESAIFTVIAFGLMVPLGLMIDRVVYSRRHKRWEEKRAARK